LFEKNSAYLGTLHEMDYKKRISLVKGKESLFLVKSGRFSTQ